MTIINKKINNICYKCKGEKIYKNKKCSTCLGTGIWIEDIYYFIDNKQKICFDGDTCK